MRFKSVIHLQSLDCLKDVALAAMRVFTGIFLMHGTWDNIISSERMGEFSGFMQTNGFALPGLMAGLSVYAQFICGGLMVLGLLTRWAGLIMVFNFIVAFVMVHLDDPFRAQFPALILIFVNFYLAAEGSGRFGLDRILFKSDF